ncbi:hypothetical protein EJ357_03900 [Streptomyces cyaneochromogenes]|uniref:Uncharacterized protein n=1 Tax=Streptomyces cyaneochromogenes TaxID=2496836 RepID=A0A3Q9ENW8_9ACTN|nr:hypothetical protein EJ357_03900 [Streptomyces cyaneochromogenes]
MTAPTAPRKALKVAETGWTKARHLRGQAIRTCVSAVEDGNTPPSAQASTTSTERNIVRGED